MAAKLGSAKEDVSQKMEKVSIDASAKIQSSKEAIGKSLQDTKDYVGDSMEYPSLKNWITKRLGYPYEKHIYKTADGYLNSVMRIPGRKGTSNTILKNGVQHCPVTGPVVIYQHGLCDCCAGILCREEESLGLRLVNKGFDLWLPNTRGNRYSKDHVKADENGV